MLDIKLFLLSCVSCLFLFNCCRDNTNGKKQETQTQKFIKDIPRYKNGKTIFFYSKTKEYAPKASLKILENGFDSICIRLWYMYAYGPWQVVEIKRDLNGWTGEFSLLTEVVTKNDSSRYISKSTISKIPDSGWDEFINKLLSKNITTLSGDILIPDYQFNMDGESYITEIATKKYYRIFSYSSLGSNLNLKDARTMADIILLIEKEFGVERLYKEF